MQRMIATAWIERISDRNELHHRTQILLDRRPLNPPSKITPKLTF